MAGSIEIEVGAELARDAPLVDKVIDSVLHFDMQALGQFFGEIALWGMLHPGFGGGEQRAVTREPNSLMRPQSISVEAGDLTQRVVTSAMGIAGERVELLQASEDRQVHGRTESTLEIREGGQLAAKHV